ncbi:MAG: hypothetical protein V1724_05845, partial [Chloroflexota bacterium]
GKIYTAKDGRFSVFISDDLHPPPLRATKFRDERMARLKNWKGHTAGMWMICQTRAEIGQDPELAQAMRDVGIEMLYTGVESSNAKNLLAVNKRQDPGQVNRDLVTLNEMGFVVAAMTIIGLPYDTEESIMEMADWVKTVSRYQTANLLTPLPATINWTTLAPLDEDGSLLPEGKMRPYHLYTGKQFVHHDKRWGLQESRDLYARYTGRLHPVDKLYERIFRMFRSKAYYGVMERRQVQERIVISGRPAIEVYASGIVQLQETVSSTIRRTRDSLSSTIGELVASMSRFQYPEARRSSRVREESDVIATKVHDLQQTVSVKTEEIRETVVRNTAQLMENLSSTSDDVRGSLSLKLEEVSTAVYARLDELKASTATQIGELRDAVSSHAGKMEESLRSRIDEVGESVSIKLTELGDTLSATIEEFKRRVNDLSTSAGSRPLASR